MGFDEKDIEQWVDEHSDYLLNYTLSKITDRDLAFDLIQDTFIAALGAVDKFEGRSSPRTWLTSILNRKIIDHWRKKGSQKTDVASHFFYGEGDKSEGHWIMENAPNQQIASIEQEIESEEQVKELEDCLAILPEQWRGIVYAKYMEQKKGEEICNEFQVTSSNFWVIVHRAKLALRDCLKSKWL